MGRVTVGVFLTIVAVVVFMLAPVVAPIGDASELDMIAWALGVYALGRIVP